MSRLILAAAASFLTAVLPLAALAADEPPPAGAAAAQPSQATDATASIGPTAAPAASSTAVNPIPQNYPVPENQADKLLPTDPGVVTNGPVPDTAANRAKDGKPLSNAGRNTPPAGN